MDAFFIGLQFLTRIHVVKQTVWTEEAFGKSVRYFPLVGLVLGLIYGGLAWGMEYGAAYGGIAVPVHFKAALFVLLPIMLTGGIHCDGFMDTADGIFSGRERERMLEIMKDSRCGSFGVTALACYLLLEYAVLQDMGVGILPVALLIMPILGRMSMVMAISCFPYARPEGVGKAFGKFANRKMCAMVVLYTAIMLALIDCFALAALVAVVIFTWLMGRYVTKLLGGLTGDVYGAICTMNELLVLVVYLLGHLQ